MTTTTTNTAPDTVVPACAHCRHYAQDRQTLEQRIAGLVMLGSGFGASVAESRLCCVHDRLVLPADTCGRFVLCG
jgi:hypothetical protein